MPPSITARARCASCTSEPTWPRSLRRHREPTVVSVAGLEPRKRIDDLLRAVWLLRDRHPELCLRLVGDGPQRRALEHLARELELDGRVTFVGRVAHEQALAETAAATVFALPSIDEAFGVAYVEAMAAGVPAIGSRGEGGPEEIAAAGEGMLLVPPGDVEALAGVIDGLLRDEAWRADVGRRARATALGAFSWERCGRETVRAYEDVLGGRA